MQELKSCPFCGSTEMDFGVSSPNKDEATIWVQCLSCAARGPAYGYYVAGKEKAINTWNDTPRKNALEKLEKENDWLAAHALCHCESGRLACPSDFQNISCPPFEAWRAMAIARGWNDVACIIDKAQCMEHGIKCWRDAARKAVEEECQSR